MTTEQERLIKLDVIGKVLKLLAYVRDQEDEGLESLRKKLVDWQESLQVVHQ